MARSTFSLSTTAAFALLLAGVASAATVTLHKYDDASARCGQVVVEADNVDPAKKDDPELEEGSCAGAGYTLTQGRSFRYENGSNYVIDYFVSEEGSNAVLHLVSAASGRCGQVIINANYVPAAIKAFPDLKSGSCGFSGYEVLGESSTFEAQGLVFPLTYYWKRGDSAILHAYNTESGRCGQTVVNMSNVPQAKSYNPDLKDGSCFSAGYTRDDGTGTQQHQNETFQIRYFVKDPTVAVLRAVNINSARCAHFNINAADVAAAKAANPFLEDGACEAVGYKTSDGSGVQTQQGVNVHYDFFLKSAADGALVHSYSDYSGQCGQIAINASIVDDAIKFQPSLQRGGCLANGFFFSNGIVSENKDNLNFDVEYFTMTGRSVFIRGFDDDSKKRCGQSTIRRAGVRAAMANDPGLELGACNVLGYTKYDGTGQQRYIDVLVDILYFVEPTSAN